MFGDQHGVLIGRVRVTRLDSGGQPPVQSGAIRFQLSFVGHGANQRMPELIFVACGETHLVDELGVDQLVDAGLDFQADQ